MGMASEELRASAAKESPLPIVDIWKCISVYLYKFYCLEHRESTLEWPSTVYTAACVAGAYGCLPDLFFNQESDARTFWYKVFLRYGLFTTIALHR